MGPFLSVLATAAVATSTAAAKPNADATGATVRSDLDAWNATIPKLWIDAATDVPIHVGGRLEVEAWHRLRSWSSLGVLPGPYVELIDAIAQEVGGYDDATSELVRSSLERSLVWRLHTGWRPFPREGLTIDVGYTLATLGGDTRTSDLLSAALGRELQGSGGNTYDIDATLHMLGVEVGWRFHLARGLTLRTAVGFAGTVASATSVQPAVRTPVSDGIARELEAYLDGIFTSYVHVPYASLSLGYALHRLF